MYRQMIKNKIVELNNIIMIYTILRRLNIEYRPARAVVAV